CRRLGSTPAWDGDRYVASPASGFARRVRRRSGRSVRLRPVLGSLLPGSHPTTSTTTHPSPTASLTVQTRQNQGWPSCGSSQSRSRASENHTVAINITGPCDDQAVLHHEMGLTAVGATPEPGIGGVAGDRRGDEAEGLLSRRVARLRTVER